MGKTIKNEKRGKGRVPGKSARERLAKYQRLSPTRSAIFQTAAQIFELMRVLDENNMDKKKTAKDMGICYQTVNRYEAKYWTEYEAKKKIDIEEAERRARATLVTYDNPEELTVEVVDNNGIMVPDAASQIQFEVTGNAKIVGVDNGNQTSHESLKGSTIKAFNGKCLVVVQAGENVGEVVLTAKANGLKESQVSIQMKNN
jgi:hypothetical protein